MGTYSFADVNATLAGPGGTFGLGYGSGSAEEGITVEMIEEKDLMTVGADGQVMHSLRASNAARVTVRLLKTSPTNALLNALYNFQRILTANWGNNVIVISNTNTGDVVTLTRAAFGRQSPLTYAKDGGMNEWLFMGTVEQLLGVGVPDVNV